MTIWQKEIFIGIILLLNTILSLGYIIFGIVRTIRHREKKLTKYVILGLFMLFCPVAGPVFLSVGTLLYRIFFDSSIDLAAITFSKDRVDVLEHPDVESEMNLVPMEEAILIDDKENLRQLLLTVLRGDVSKSINTVTKALNSSDSEASHYAASAIMDITNEFQTTLQKFHAQLEATPNDKEVNCLFIEYLIKMLNTNFLSDMELKTYIYTLSQTFQNVYDFDKSILTALYYSNLVSLLTRIGDYEAAQLWVTRLLEQHPDEIETYRCVLRYYYLTQNKEQFFFYMNQLKHSEISIDKDLLELIRIYN